MRDITLSEALELVNLFCRAFGFHLYTSDVSRYSLFFLLIRLVMNLEILHAASDESDNK